MKLVLNAAVIAANQTPTHVHCRSELRYVYIWHDQPDHNGAVDSDADVGFAPHVLYTHKWHPLERYLA